MKTPESNQITTSAVGTTIITPYENSANIALVSMRLRGKDIIVGGTPQQLKNGSGSHGYSGTEYELGELVTNTVSKLSGIDSGVVTRQPEVILNGQNEVRVPFVEKGEETVVFVAIAHSQRQDDPEGKGAILKAMTEGHIAFIEQGDIAKGGE